MRWRLRNGTIHPHGRRDRLLEMISQAWWKKKPPTHRCHLLVICQITKVFFCRRFSSRYCFQLSVKNASKVSGDASEGLATEQSCGVFHRIKAFMTCFWFGFFNRLRLAGLRRERSET